MIAGESIQFSLCDSGINSAVYRANLAMPGQLSRREDFWDNQYGPPKRDAIRPPQSEMLEVKSKMSGSGFEANNRNLKDKYWHLSRSQSKRQHQGDAFFVIQPFPAPYFVKLGKALEKKTRQHYSSK